MFHEILQETDVSCFIVCAVPLKYINLLHHTNISYFTQHVSSNFFHWCAPCLRGLYQDLHKKYEGALAKNAELVKLTSELGVEN